MEPSRERAHAPVLSTALVKVWRRRGISLLNTPAAYAGQIIQGVGRGPLEIADGTVMQAYARRRAPALKAGKYGERLGRPSMTCAPDPLIGVPQCRDHSPGAGAYELEHIQVKIQAEPT